MNAVKAVVAKGVNRNCCTTWEWLHWEKLFNRNYRWT